MGKNKNKGTPPLRNAAQGIGRTQGGQQASTMARRLLHRLHLLGAQGPACALAPCNHQVPLLVPSQLCHALSPVPIPGPTWKCCSFLSFSKYYQHILM